MSYISVRILQHVSSYYDICVLTLLVLYICPHPATCFLMLLQAEATQKLGDIIRAAGIKAE